MANWTIVHKAHGDVATGEVNPQELEFAIYLSRIGYCNYKVDLANPQARRTFIEPYASDYELRRGSLVLQAGMHTSVNWDIESRQLQVAGQDWNHYLERQTFPFNPDPDHVTDYQFSRVQVDLFTVIEDMLDVVLSMPYTLDFTYNNGTTGYLINYRIDLGDTGDIFSKITDLAGQDPNGFDFLTTPQRNFQMYYPKLVNTSSFVMEQGRNILKLAGTDKGLDGNSLLAFGAGSSSHVGVLLENTSSMIKYRRHCFTKDFGNISDPTVLQGMGQAELNRGSTPVVDLTATVKPQAIDDVWNNLHVGDSVYVHGWTDYQEIKDYYRCVGMKGNISNQGDEYLDVLFTEDA